MRKPKQVLVFLYKFDNVDNEYKYCLFFRSDKKFYQAISGGVEDEEQLTDTVVRELYEETGITNISKIYKLSTNSSIPVVNITGEYTWGEDVYIATEYCFAIEITNQEIKLSNEHKSYKWLSYNESINLLKYDSNKTALWELNERLLKKDLKV